MQTSNAPVQRPEIPRSDAPAATPVAQISLSHNVAISEYADCYQVVANVRDVAEDDVIISLRGHILSIVGDDFAADTERDLQAMNHGSFRYNIGLPEDADEDSVSHRYADGMLVLTIGRL
jgi:HSP20 family molecular chaperone IbpA